MHDFEDVFFDAIVGLGLAGHAIIVVTKVANFQRMLFHLECLEKPRHFLLV
jgi:hypothetical protein